VYIGKAVIGSSDFFVTGLRLTLALLLFTYLLNYLFSVYAQAFCRAVLPE